MGTEGQAEGARGGWMGTTHPRASRETGKYASPLLPRAGGTRATEKLYQAAFASFLFFAGAYSLSPVNLELGESERMKSA